MTEVLPGKRATLSLVLEQLINLTEICEAARGESKAREDRWLEELRNVSSKLESLNTSLDLVRNEQKRLGTLHADHEREINAIKSQIDELRARIAVLEGGG